MKRIALVVFLKELRESLRDRRAMSLLAVFVVIYPALLGAMLTHIIDRATKPEREGIELAVIGGKQAPTLMAMLKQHNITARDMAPMTDAAITDLLRANRTAAVLKLSEHYAENYAAMRPARVELWTDSAADASRKAREVEDVLREYSANIAGARLLAHGVSQAALAPVLVQRYDTGTSASRSASLIGTMLGTLFAPAFIFCLATAIDSTAGERERHTLEVLLAQPVRVRELMFGKLMAAAALSVVGITLELLFMHFLLKWLPLEEIGMSWRLTGWQLAAVILATMPLCLFAAACELALAMNARSFKEAQTTLNLAIAVPMLAAVIIPMLEAGTATWMYGVPFISNLTLLRELSKGQDIGLLPFALTAGVALMLALLCMLWSVRRMESEKYVRTV